VGFKPTIPVFMQAIMVHASECMATVTGISKQQEYIILLAAYDFSYCGGEGGVMGVMKQGLKESIRNYC
jgi:hypothetical protein